LSRKGKDIRRLGGEEGRREEGRRGKRGKTSVEGKKKNVPRRVEKEGKRRPKEKGKI